MRATAMPVWTHFHCKEFIMGDHVFHEDYNCVMVSDCLSAASCSRFMLNIFLSITLII